MISELELNGHAIERVYEHGRLSDCGASRRVTLAPGRTTTVTWPLTGNDVGYYDNGGRFRVENGTIEVYAGDSSSESDNRATFDVVNGQPHGQGNPFGPVLSSRAAMAAALRRP